MLQEKIVLVTGATDGIGMQTALELGRLGYHVLVHGRNPERGAWLLESLRRKAGNNRMDLLIADFRSLEEVRVLAAQVKERYPRLDVLVNNAGVYMDERWLTRDGLETTFQVNYLAPFLLTRLLLARLAASAPARIINVSSGTHGSIGRVDFDNLQGEKSYDGYEAYALSKLGNLLFTYKLAERFKTPAITCNALHPGAVETKLLRAGFTGHGVSLQKGAETPVFLAESPDVAGVNAKYFVNRVPVRSSVLSYDRDLQDKLWETSEKLAGLVAG